MGHPDGGLTPLFYDTSWVTQSVRTGHRFSILNDGLIPALPNDPSDFCVGTIPGAEPVDRVWCERRSTTTGAVGVEVGVALPQDDDVDVGTRVKEWVPSFWVPIYVGRVGVNHGTSVSRGPPARADYT